MKSSIKKILVAAYGVLLTLFVLSMVLVSALFN